MYTPKFSTKRVLGLVMASALAASGIVGIAGSSEAAVASFTIAPKTGPTTTGTVLTITGTGFQTAAGASTLTTSASGLGAVQWTNATCAPTWVAAAGSTPTINSVAITVQSAKVLVVTAPVLALTSSKATAWTACVYGTANSLALLGTAKYTAYPVATVTAANSPASGPASGGNSVIVTGTGFTSASKVKFGTVLSTKVTVAKDGLSLTAVAPAQGAGAVAVVVTTEGGANPTPATPAWDDYTYVNGITVSPQTGVSGVAHAITVKGVGFSAIFAAPGGTPTNANADVVVTLKGMTSATDDIATYSCGASIQVISDTQLVCTLPATLVDGAYIIVVTADNSSATGGTPVYETVVSSGATYTSAAF